MSPQDIHIFHLENQLKNETFNVNLCKLVEPKYNLITICEIQRLNNYAKMCKF